MLIKLEIYKKFFYEVFCLVIGIVLFMIKVKVWLIMISIILK